jgi:putative ABC transport system ATP-binding protein
VTAIAVEALRFAYPAGPFTLRIEQLHIAAGEHVACVGGSGSGKTTLIHLLAGIEVPVHGSVRLADVAVSALPDAARAAFRLAHIGLLFQDLELLPYLCARDNILLPFHLAGGSAPTPARTAAAHALADSVGLPADLLRRRPHQLSQGERQRVALCRALITAPRLILCDEPTGNLDPEAAARVLDLVRARARELGATLFLVTHDHSLLPRFDRVLDMATLASSP